MSKAVTLAGLAENYLQKESQTLLESDMMALDHLLIVGKQKLGKNLFDQTCRQGESSRLEDLVAQELPSEAQVSSDH